jgi:two-component system response regulator YesN
MDAEYNVIDLYPKKYSQYVCMAMEIITNKFSSQITLKDIANEINISPKYLSSLFKKEVGCGIYIVICIMRITKAKQLIASNSSIKATAFEVGFNDSKAFSKMFSRITGEYPSTFRRRTLLSKSSFFDYTSLE